MSKEYSCELLPQGPSNIHQFAKTPFEAVIGKTQEINLDKLQNRSAYDIYHFLLGGYFERKGKFDQSIYYYTRAGIVLPQEQLFCLDGFMFDKIKSLQHDTTDYGDKISQYSEQLADFYQRCGSSYLCDEGYGNHGGEYAFDEASKLIENYM